MRLQADVILYDVTDVKCASMDAVDKVRARIVKALSEAGFKADVQDVYPMLRDTHDSE